MNAIKRNINGSSYIGAFSACSEKITLLGNGIIPKDEAIVADALGTETIKISINGSNLIGIYAVLNSNGILLPELAFTEDISGISRMKSGAKVAIIKSDLNALGNNVLANDKIAIINPRFPKPAADSIGDALDVEVIKMSIGGYETVGASNILTNSGMVLNNRATEEELDLAKELVGNVSQSTANLGSGFIGLASIANSKGIIVGEETTGFELARMEQGLSSE